MLCPPPESKRNRLSQHLAWEWRGPVFLKWIGVVFPERICKQGDKKTVHVHYILPSELWFPMWGTTSLASDQQLQCLPASERPSLPIQPCWVLNDARQTKPCDSCTELWFQIGTGLSALWDLSQPYTQGPKILNSHLFYLCLFLVSF